MSARCGPAFCLKPMVGRHALRALVPPYARSLTTSATCGALARMDRLCAPSRGRAKEIAGIPFAACHPAAYARNDPARKHGCPCAPRCRGKRSEDAARKHECGNSRNWCPKHAAHTGLLAHLGKGRTSEREAFPSGLPRRRHNWQATMRRSDTPTLFLPPPQPAEENRLRRCDAGSSSVISPSGQARR